jgi:hypothetical protein
MEIEKTYDDLFVNLPSVYNELPFGMKQIVASYSITPSASIIKKLPPYFKPCLDTSLDIYFNIQKIKLFLKKIPPQLLQTYPYQNLVLTISDKYIPKPRPYKKNYTPTPDNNWYYLPNPDKTCYSRCVFKSLNQRNGKRITGLKNNKKKELIIRMLKENGSVFKESERLFKLEDYLWYDITTSNKVKNWKFLF